MQRAAREGTPPPTPGKGAPVAAHRAGRRLIALLAVAAILAGGVALWWARPGVQSPPADPGVSRIAAWPDATNTGPPPGTPLQPFDGDCAVTQRAVTIDAKTLTCDLVVRAADLVVIRSEIRGRVVVLDGGSVTIEDSSVDGGQQDTFPAIGQQHVVLRRVDVTGGQHSVQCQVACIIEDSWLHDQATPSAGSHMNAFLSNGGHDMRLTHNTIACSVAPNPAGGGCTADASLFGDFAPIEGVVFERNRFVANAAGEGYCVQAGSGPAKAYPNPTRVVFEGNVFERGPLGTCGRYGPVTAFDASQASNRWVGNTWDDGTPVSP